MAKLIGNQGYYRKGYTVEHFADAEKRFAEAEADKKQIDNFKASVHSKDMHDAIMRDMYGSYEQYISQSIENAKDLTEKQKTYLIQYYGIGDRDTNYKNLSSGQASDAHKQLVGNANSGAGNAFTVYSANDVNAWSKTATDVGKRAYQYVSTEGYKAPDENLIKEIDKLLASSNDVAQYIRANKGKYQDYESLYNGYVDTVNYLKSLKSAVEGSNKVFSKFKTEKDYEDWKIGWLYDDAETNAETAKARQDRYASNQARITEIDNEIAKFKKQGMTGGTYIQSQGHYVGQTYKKQAEIDALIKEKETLQAENNRYYNGQRILDIYYQPVTDEFLANGANRDYSNASKEELEAHDAAFREASEKLSGNSFDSEGNIVNSLGRIEYAADDYTVAMMNNAEEDFYENVVNDKLGMFLSANTKDVTEAYNKISQTNGNYKNTWAELIREGDQNGWKYLKPEELNIYYDLYYREGKTAAYKFLDKMTTTLTRRATQAVSDEIENASGFEKIVLNAASVPMSVFGGVAGVVDDVSNIVQGKDINPYSRAHILSNAASDIRTTTANDIENWTGGISLPWVGTTFGDVYQSIMSFADSALASLIPGGAVLLGMNAASSQMKNLYERGASIEQIFAGGLLAGAAEGFFEHFSIEKLKSIGNVNKKAVKSFSDRFVKTVVMGGVEASEEMATEIANTISDALVMGSQSDWVDFNTFVKNVVNAGIGGFLSGGIGGAIASEINNSQYKARVTHYGQQIIKSGQYDNLYDFAIELSSKEKSKELGEIKRLAEKTHKNTTARNVGMLSEAIKSYRTKQNIDEIESILKKKGMNKTQAKEFAEYICHAIDKNGMSTKQHTSIVQNPIAYEVFNEIISNLDSSINQRNVKYALGKLGIQLNKYDNVDGQVQEGYNKSGTTLTPEQKERYDAAILKYKSSESYKINAQLREDEILTEEEEEFVDTLDEALEQLPTYEGTVYRQITFDDFGGEEAFNDFLAEHTPGNFIFYSQYTSCSTIENGYTVEGDYKVQLIVDGKTARDVDGYGNNAEYEVIFPRNTMFVVKNIDTSGKFPIIYLQEDVENGHDTNEEQGETVRNLQASHSVHGDVQGVSEKDTAGYRVGQVRPQPASSGGQRNTVRAERGNGTLLSAKSEEQEVGSNTDSAPTGGRVLDMPAITVKQQNFIKKIGKALGRKVEFVNMDKFLKKHNVDTEGLKIYPDGAIDVEGNIYIWYNAEKPVQFLFKHELTHFGERSKLYKKFVKIIRKTNAYKAWLETAVRETESWKEWRRTRPENPHLDIDGMEKFLREDRIAARNGLKQIGPGEAQTEIIADFVAEKCFGESLEALKGIVEAVENVKERNVVAQFLYDFFNNIQQKLKGISKIDREIGRIEDLFARMIDDANKTKTSDTNGGGLKYSYAGNKALTANRSALTDAVVVKAKGLDDAVILEQTGWFKGGDGKWRYNIPDNELKINFKLLYSDSMTLGDFVKHDKLFAAYPELKNIKLSFKQRAKGKNGSYNHSNNEIVLNTLLRNDIDKLKNTLVHEMQHAIQYIEGFAQGGTAALGRRIIFNYAYEQVKDTEDFKNLSTKNEKTKYVFEVAIKLFGAKNIEDAANTAYKNLYGEVEAREVANSRQFDEKELRKLKPDTTGSIVDKVSVVEDYIANLTEIGYTEEEILNQFGGNANDQSGSAQNISERRENGIGVRRLFPNYEVRGTIPFFGDRTDSEGETGDMGPGVPAATSDGGRRGTGSDLKFSVPTATENEAETDTSTDFTALRKELLERYKNGEITEQEFSDQMDALWERAINENGQIKPGEKVSAENKDFPVPKSVKAGTKVREAVRTILGSGYATPEMEAFLKSMILSGEFSFEPTSDKARINKAEESINKQGYQKALTEWQKRIHNVFAKDENLAVEGEALLKLAMEHKGAVDVLNIAADLAEFGTRTGRNLQAMKILKKMGGMAQLVYVERCVAKINSNLQQRFARKKKKGKDIPVVKIDPILAEQLAISKTEEDYEVAYEAIMRNIAEQVPSTFLDKLNSWRYIAMLMNPTTHIGNFFGNLIFVPMVRIKNILGSVMELTVSKEQRTKSIVVKKEYKDFAEKDFEEVKELIMGSGKYNPSDSVQQYRKIYKWKWLEALRKFNFDALEWVDAIFIKVHYKHALGGYLQAQGIDLENISTEQMVKAREYAIQEALKATYRDASRVANILSELSKNSKIMNVGIEGNLPFKKTPINIMKRGVEYSPTGILVTLKRALEQLSKGEFSATDFIDGLASTFTGTGVFVLGYFLATLGIAKGGFDDEDKWFRELNGEQEYSIEIGGKSYTISWMAPACIPFFMGVALAEYATDEDGDFLSNIGDFFAQGFEPLLELSCLSGVEDLLSGIKFATSGNSVYAIIGNSGGSYLSQLLPTIGGKVANLFDDTRRMKYIDKTSDVPEFAQEILDKIAAKMPFASRTRAEYINAWGETEYTGNFLERFFQQFVSRAYISDVNVTDTSEELMRLRKVTGESGIYPSTPKKYFTVRGERRDLSKEEYFDYATFKGQTQYDLIDEAIHSSQYAKLTDEQKVKVIKDIYSYAGALAKCQLDYSYEEIAAMEGEDTKGNMILTEEKYNRLDEKAKRMLVDEYFMESSNNVKAYKYAKNGRSVVEYFCDKVKDD